VRADHGDHADYGRIHPDQGGEEPPPQKAPQADAISTVVTRVNAEADAAPDRLRVSLDTKATVKIGPFARGGKERVPVMAADHDFRPQATVTPVGLFLPRTDGLFIDHVTSKVTSDCPVDCLEQGWEAHKARFASLTTPVLNLDNGPENHSHRTQFMGRLTALLLCVDGFAAYVGAVRTVVRVAMRTDRPGRPRLVLPETLFAKGPPSCVLPSAPPALSKPRAIISIGSSPA